MGSTHFNKHVHLHPPPKKSVTNYDFDVLRCDVRLRWLVAMFINLHLIHFEVFEAANKSSMETHEKKGQGSVLLFFFEAASTWAHTHCFKVCGA